MGFGGGSTGSCQASLHWGRDAQVVDHHQACHLSMQAMAVMEAPPGDPDDRGHRLGALNGDGFPFLG